MPTCFEKFLVYSGDWYSVYFHAQTNGCSEVFNYYKGCNDATRASLLYLVKRMADVGQIYDETKFRLEDKQAKIYCFKPKDERFFCFFLIGRKIIITSAYSKKKQKLDLRELMKAIKIREEYL
ncbi:MAG: type II toxin-antitoxin system RelE/ParE family toxin [Candidatus Omnitrophota bacterium]